ncbi:MAG: diguanylate cyclase response regulator [Cyanobacteria bacterium QS_4_48_99]|nr:MAG: diguanylate cyclase response regulator [Cyanobacteria bacterium QS_4_48_99]
MKNRILVVEDDRDTRELLREVMESEGYEVAEASNGQACLEAYQRQLPDVVLLDAMMPVMDGFTCCKQLQTLFRQASGEDIHEQGQETLQAEANGILTSLKRAPVLMTTALDDPASVERAFAAGATDYITKPIHWEVLRQRVQHLIEQSQLYRQLEAAYRELNRLASLDNLTKLANRRRFDEFLEREWRRMAREKGQLSLVLCDIDDFKLYNDTYGHLTGDFCLYRVAAAIEREAKRPGDLVARYGGEEFAAILPNTDRSGALVVAQKMQESVKALQIPHKTSTASEYVTLSVGTACLFPIPEQDSPAPLFKAADQALYQAKAAGRDRMIAYSG